MKNIEIRHNIHLHLKTIDTLLEALEPDEAFDYAQQLIFHFNLIKAVLDPENEHKPHHDN